MLAYFLKRMLRGAFSVVVAVSIIMLLLFFVLDKSLIFSEDEQYSKLQYNQKTTYMYTMWEKYGYLDYVTFNDWLNELVAKGELDAAFKESIAGIPRTPERDSADFAEYAARFREVYEAKGYTVVRQDAVMAGKTNVAKGGAAIYFAYYNTPVFARVANFFGSLLTFDNIHYVDESVDLGERGLTFTWYDPAYGGEKLSPAILGNGTYHKYLLYCDSRFPYLHQNFMKLTLGTSYTVNKGVDVFETMTQSQGVYYSSTTYYPTGLVEESADNLHTARYVQGSRELSQVNADRYTDDYTNVDLQLSSRSRIYYSYIVNIIGSFITISIGIPLGILVARKKDTWVDSLGNAYVVFMIAVPSLAYYFLVKGVCNLFGLPVLFSLSDKSVLIFVTPVIASCLASISGEMRWMRRYMVDQMNSDYVKFARSEGLSEREIFAKHIFKNAAIPIAHGIPNIFIMALSGSIMMERIYNIPGVGGLLINAISKYDNQVIVGVALFYGVLSILSAVLGDITMAIMDPRINYTTKAR